MTVVLPLARWSFLQHHVGYLCIGAFGPTARVIMRRSRVSAGTMASLAVLAAAVLTGCSAAAAPVRVPAAVKAPAAGSAALARTTAQRLLSSLIAPGGALPAGWSPLAGPVPADLQHEGEGPVVTSQAVNIRDVLTAPQSMSSVFAYLKAHMPAGVGSIGSGQTTEHGQLASDEITGQLSAVPAGIYLAAMSETIVASSAGHSLVLVDAEVVWHPARSAAEYLTASRFSAVHITATPTSGKKPPVRKTLTSPADLARLVNLLDGLQAAPQVPPGNLLPAATYQLSFTPAKASQPAVRVGDSGVLTETVAVGGAAQPDLWDPANSLASLIDQLAGITV
jgi:hypothetical protein